MVNAFKQFESADLAATFTEEGPGESAVYDNVDGVSISTVVIPEYGESMDSNGFINNPAAVLRLHIQALHGSHLLAETFHR